MRELTRPLAALLTGVVLLAGCGGSAEPKPLPKAKASTSPSASASPPAMPAAVKSKTKAGAKATVRHFVSALNFAGQSGDTGHLRASYVGTCTKCQGMADGIDRTYAAGGYYKGGDWVSPELTFYAIDRGVATLDARVAYEAQVWVKRKGAEPVRFRSSRNHLHAFQLKWVPQRGWRVGALDPQL